jgi:hypothetical protein
MDLICPFVQVMVNFLQSVMNLSWTPFAWLGVAAPSVIGWIQLLAPWCTLE